MPSSAEDLFEIMSFSLLGSSENGRAYVELATLLANDENFQRTFNRYVLTVKVDLRQFTHFRVNIVREMENFLRRQQHNRIQGSNFSNKLIWCALLLASERYFETQGKMHAWTQAEIEEQRLGWLRLLKPCYRPSEQDIKLDINVLKHWRNKQYSLEENSSGPFAACTSCTSKCQYHIEVSQNLQDVQLRTEFKSHMALTEKLTAEANADSLAGFGSLLSERWIGQFDLDLAYCAAVHLLKNDCSNFDQVVPPSHVRRKLEVLAKEQGSSAQEKIEPPEPDQKQSTNQKAVLESKPTTADTKRNSGQQSGNKKKLNNAVNVIKRLIKEQQAAAASENPQPPASAEKFMGPGSSTHLIGGAQESEFDKNINEYFRGFEGIISASREYLSNTLRFFDQCGIIELLVKGGKQARFEDLANGVSSKQEGIYAVFDPAEYEREQEFFRKFGSIMAVPNQQKTFIEVRLNLVVAHEMGHQIRTFLRPEFLGRIAEIYNANRQNCNHRLEESPSELILPHELEKRHFISGWARSGLANYWAECFCSFSDKESNAELKKIDPESHAALCEFFLSPEKALMAPWSNSISEIRTTRKINVDGVSELFKSL